METNSETSPIGNQPSLGVGEYIKSLDNFNNVDVEDLGDGDDKDFNVDEDIIWRRQKVNSVATIASLRFKPMSVSRFLIPLCCMVAVLM